MISREIQNAKKRYNMGFFMGKTRKFKEKIVGIFQDLRNLQKNLQRKSNFEYFYVFLVFMLVFMLKFSKKNSFT